ncbi:MAG TPA: hypothetical protein VNQ77_08225 [Frankiaceae bacterium]|nr:hypothetical protein [Frankiaceae bacterium]
MTFLMPGQHERRQDHEIRRYRRGVSIHAGRGRYHLVFLFFSNRLGCLGSLALSVGVTLVLLFLMGVLR